MEIKKEIYHALLDETMQDSYIDADEQRLRVLPDGTELPYRYVHGGFRQNKIKFIVCLPPKKDYRGRFFQYLSPFPGPDEEVASLGKTGADDKIAFCLANGAYYVESNMGSSQMFGGAPNPSMVYKASAAAAEFSRKIAMEYYGCSRPYGYVHGGSGGGYKTMACIENTDAFDGAVPYVIGSPMSLPNTITMHAQGQRVLRNAFPKILDAVDAGGSGDPYENLNAEEAAMLEELTKMGFPPIAWFPEAWGIVNDGSLPVLTPGVKGADPSYFTEFWTVPGYEGADPASGAVRDRLQFQGVVKAVHSGKNLAGENLNNADDAWKKMLGSSEGAWIALEEIPQGEDLYLKGVNITITSGPAAGTVMLLDRLIPAPESKSGLLTVGMCYGMADIASVISSIRPGDTLTLDNSDYIAIQSYYRHQVPSDTSFHAWDQFRKADGTPSIPQRPFVMGPGFCGTGTVQDGQIQGKVLQIQALADESTCPWCGDWYRRKVAQAGNAENHRIYYMERCMHGDLSNLENNMVTNYVGALQQALLDLSDWVERGIEPKASTVYTMKDNQVLVPERAEDRKGLQCTVQLTANGSACAHVKAGEPVRLHAEIQIPADIGTVTEVCFRFDEEKVFPAENPFPQAHPFTLTGEGAEAEITHTYLEKGTFFASVRVKAHRTGNAATPFAQVRNLARARIVVE